MKKAFHSERIMDFFSKKSSNQNILDIFAPEIVARRVMLFPKKY